MKRYFSSWMIAIICALLVLSNCFLPTTAEFPYSEGEMNMYIRTFFENIFLNDYAIIAARTRENPDYWYDWVRDSGITLQVVDALYKSWGNSTDYGPVFERYKTWNQMSLSQPNPHGIDIRGDVKFFVDGRVYTGEWCRPQTDGPALRAMSMMSYADHLSRQGYFDMASRLYKKDGECCGIKYDLEFISKNWDKFYSNCDLWEEVRGEHFFTLMVQRKALVLGARLALTHADDPGAAEWYLKNAEDIGRKLNEFVDHSRNIIRPTMNYNDSDFIAKSKEDLDSAIHLGSLYGQITANDVDDITQLSQQLASRGRYHSLSIQRELLLSFQPNDDLILNSWHGLSQWSANNYEINEQSRHQNRTENAIARYPNDIYDGYGTSRGNPWVLSTASSANIWYYTANQLYKAYTSQETYTITMAGQQVWSHLLADKLTHLSTIDRYTLQTVQQQLMAMRSDHDEVIVSGDQLRALGNAAIERGDNLFKQIRFYVGDEKNVPEQIHRDTGQRVGAQYLTWSYGTMIAAYLERQKSSLYF